jgi:hypothetical protein
MSTWKPASKKCSAVRLQPLNKAGAAIKRARQAVQTDSIRNELLAFCLRGKLSAPVTEYRFHGIRQWRFDYAWPTEHIALEVEGGVFSGGRHIQGAGFRADMEKYNAAAELDWRVLRFMPEQMLSGMYRKVLFNCLKNEG